jgi:dTDP-4-dehydrorhamnose reductase
MSESLTGAEGGSVAVQPKRVLVLGGSGMLGQEVVRHLADRRWFVAAPSHIELDVTWPQHLEKLRLRDFGEFDWVVNCAAYTQVDQAELEPMAAMNVNGVAPGTIASVCHQNGWSLLHVSTDFLFDGESDTPYTEDNLPSPLGIYGRSKLFGEQNVLSEKPDSLIVRTAWLFGPTGKCFPRTMIEAWLAG